jgi:uncharacterized protein
MADTCFDDVAPRRIDEAALHPWLDVSRNVASPFVHRFRTQQQEYVYDVNTRRIIRVSRVVWDILEDFGCLDHAQIVAKHGSHHSPDQIGSAMKQIAQVQEEQGMFLAVRPKQVLPPSREPVEKQLADYREQLILNVTEECCFRCSYCVYGGEYPQHRRHSSKKMTWEVARAALDDFLAHSKLSKDRVISFYGGEPLLNLPLIRQCVMYAKERWADLKVQFGLTTNGFLLAGPATDFLAAEAFLIIVSLDGPADIHNRHRRASDGGPTWETILSNLRGFLAAHPEYKTNGKLRFNAVAGSDTDLREVQAFFRECELFSEDMGLEISGRRLCSGEPRVAMKDSPLLVSRRELLADFHAGLKSGRLGQERDLKSRWAQVSLFEKPFLLFHKRRYLSPHLPEEMRLLATCIPGERRTFVNSDGDYFACERVVECPDGKIGDVNKGLGVDKVMAILQRWNQAAGDQCRFCWCLPTCDVGCFATVSEDGGIAPESRRQACAICRANAHQLLMDYCGILEANPKAFDYTAEISLD